ncbi:bifunctional oligoribonuclease/PAP phosphatase NrnA [Desulfoprunum benzoelyticum]|uniref:Phosphoesterase RecJ-like protein n=1 Tax=Desulfoprunum benzoelyticum TaxID=1506996 RepID=A0A840V1Q5_9BACT|nr:bifunctional oligoribonuclease/PAP phosphatase NrnA [Desulfoprunum benzoelyticum]MBB5347780.1 phosphoesterase RecJ-like protein [Desulfoprunum benzoelyticum]MBM9529371.1 bifunctional oligoribonuclease/PAP phosphatase NrnA [Desulfoprunum benzoelyticum]
MRGITVTGIPEAITKCISDNQRFVLLTHIHPDGDALGSMFGLADVLESLGKEVFCFVEEPVSQLYAFLPGASRASCDLDALHDFARQVQDKTAVIALDSGDDNRLGKYKDELLAITSLMVIDHHKSHKEYGVCRWVEPSRSSTGEMVYELAMALGVEISYSCAFHLYVAICTDTGSFRFDSTHPRTFEIAAKLLEAGVNPAEISCKIYDNYSVVRLKLLQLVLATLTLYAADQIACIHVTPDMFVASGAAAQDIEGFIDYPRSLQTVKVAVFIKEVQPGNISVSLRAKGECDVAEIAKMFNGGGHRNAAGFRFADKNLAEVRTEVLSVLSQDLGVQLDKTVG